MVLFGAFPLREKDDARSHDANGRRHLDRTLDQ